MKFLLTVLILLSANVYAGQQLLLDISSNIDSETAKFFVETDANYDVVALVYSSFNRGRKLETKSVTVKQAERGVVICRKKGRDVVKLATKSFSQANGGFATITYLRNGATGSYRSMEIDLRRDGDDWNVYHNGHKIRALKFIGKRIAFLGLVGVASIKTY